MKRVNISLRQSVMTAALLASITASAYDFEVDDIYYNVVSMSDLTCEVTRGDNEYTGDVNIPEQVTYNKRTFSVISIRDKAFNGCSNLTSVTIPNSVTSIGDNAFEICRNLMSVTIPNSVTSIGDYAFSWCSGLTGVTIPNSVTTIENHAFNGCTSLETLIIEDGSSVLDLGYNSYSSSGTGEGLFYDCPLKSVYLGRNINETSQRYGYSPFYNNTTLTSVTIGDSVTWIRRYAFKGCSNLTSVTIGNSVTSIGYYAFDYCTSLTSVTTFDSMPPRGEGEFSYCSNLTSVTIGNSVTTIGNSAFGECKGLTSVTSLAQMPPWAGEDTFPAAAYLNAMLYVPIGSLDSYKSATCWKNFLIEEKDVSGVEGVKADDNLVEKARYSLDGKMLLAPEKGVNIVKMSDGTTKKVVVK